MQGRQKVERVRERKKEFEKGRRSRERQPESEEGGKSKRKAERKEKTEHFCFFFVSLLEKIFVKRELLSIGSTILYPLRLHFCWFLNNLLDICSKLKKEVR